jgi:aspartyl-tRNA(Asn)/glutamyl-tRNA(Gln) amidotransferase subunit C
MNIDKDTVKKLATLARLEVTEEEVEKLQGELGAILEYVGQINNALTSEEIEVFHPVKNAMRSDIAANKATSYTDDLLKLAPKSENGYVRVKKII